MSMNNIGILIQARTGSTRFPGKVLADLGGVTVLDWVIHRTSLNRRTRNMVVVTSQFERDNVVAEIARRSGVSVYRGSEEDVLKRYVDAAHNFGFSAVVRITADCPFIDPAVIDQVIDEFDRRPGDYVYISGYPEGIGEAELVRTSALVKALSRTSSTDVHYREHVITYLLEHPEEFDVRIVPKGTGARNGLRFSIDTLDDFARARRIAAAFYPARDFGVSGILCWVDANEAAPRADR
jgi:spore coat polysaccharide biosynthesis protein SpsF